MFSYIFSFLSAFLASLIVTPIVEKLSHKAGIIDLPSARKVHNHPIPRAGGLAIFIATMIVAGTALILLSQGHTFGVLSGQLTAMFVAGSVVLAIGLIDDLFEVSSKLKLVVLLTAAIAFCALGGSIDSIRLNGHIPVELRWAAWPVTILWIVGITVSINFIDGLDGLAGGLLAITASVIACVAASKGVPAIAVVAFSLMGGLGGFLVYNIHPARIFMGDCGSMYAGFTVACLSVLLAQRTGTVIGLGLPALTLCVPIVDLGLTMLRRGVLRRRSLFAAERGHIHHRLIDVGFRHPHAVLVIHGLSIAAAGIGLLSLAARGWSKVGALSLVLPLLLLVFRSSGSSQVHETVVALRRNRRLSRDARKARQDFEDVQTRFPNATNFDAWWSGICMAIDRLGAARAKLHLTNRDGSRRQLSWVRDTFDDVEALGPTRPPSVRATIPVEQRRSDAGDGVSLEIELPSGPNLESTGHRLALLTRLLAEYSLASLKHDLRGESAPLLSTDSADRPIGQPLRALPPNVRVAIVHDFLYTYAGAERVLEQILRLCPDADVFSLFDFIPEDRRDFLLNKAVTTSFIQRLPGVKKHHRLYLPLMPLAIEQLDLSNYEVVISSSYLVAKGVLTRPDQLHICYCHSPVRFAWDMQNQYLNQGGLTWGLKSIFARLILHYIRAYDVRSSNGVDSYATNSDFIGRRIEKIYRRPSTTIHPPVDVSGFAARLEKHDFYLTASRLVPYKRVDLIVGAFSKMPHRKLIVIGDGPERDRITEMAGPNVRMLGYQTAERLRYYMQHAKAFVFAAEEDFGIVPVEAQACGTPVIAFGRGGVTESVIQGKTGVFFRDQTIESLMAAVDEFDSFQWDAAEIRANAERFSPEVFRERFGRFLRREYAAFVSHPIVQRDARNGTLGQVISADDPTSNEEVYKRKNFAGTSALS